MLLAVPGAGGLHVADCPGIRVRELSRRDSYDNAFAETIIGLHKTGAFELADYDPVAPARSRSELSRSGGR